jgi:hypothetical protein
LEGIRKEVLASGLHEHRLDTLECARFAVIHTLGVHPEQNFDAMPSPGGDLRWCDPRAEPRVAACATTLGASPPSGASGVADCPATTTTGASVFGSAAESVSAAVCPHAVAQERSSAAVMVADLVPTLVHPETDR